MAVVKFSKSHPNAYPPVPNDVGYDIATLGDIVIPPHKLTNRVHPVSTGIKIEVPKGYYVTIKMRDIYASNTKLRLVNGHVEDGEIILWIENIGKYEQRIAAGQYIAEMFFHKVDNVKVEVNGFEL